MRLHRAPLLLLGAVLGSFLPGSRCGSSRHSLCYTYWKVAESSQEPPQFLSMVHLDNQPIARFDNHTRKMEPLVTWMEAEETKNFVAFEKVFRPYLKKLSNFSHQTGEPPVGKVTRKVVDDSLEVLICQAFGFYPKEIQAIWTRDGEACQYETLPRNVAPNSDGTYYLWLSIEIDPKERDHFRCHLEHEGLQEPLVLAWKDETAVKSSAFLALPLILATVSLCLILGCWPRIRKKLHQDVTPCPDHSYVEMHPSAPIYGTEDMIQPQLMLQPKTASEPKVSCGGWWLQKAPRAIGQTFHRLRNLAPKKTRSSRLEKTVFLT